MTRPALFLDRDGVINLDHGYVHRPEDIVFVDGIFELVAAANQKGYLVVVVTNQAGIARGYYSEADFHLLMIWIMAQFDKCGGWLDAVYFCPYHPECGVGEYRKESNCRKPAPGMLIQASEELDIELTRSIIVGDMPTDMEAAYQAGVGTRCYYVTNNDRSSLSEAATCSIYSLREVIPLLEKNFRLGS